MIHNLWIRPVVGSVGITVVAAATLIVHMYADRLVITASAAGIGISLLYWAFGTFKVEELVEAVAFGVVLVALVILGAMALASGRDVLATAAAGGVVLLGAAILKIVAHGVSARRQNPQDGRR